MSRPGAARRGGAVDLSTRIGDVQLDNPVLLASGTAGHGAELAEVLDLSAPGAVVVKSLSAQPWPGNPPPRLLPVAAGMLNSVGLQNPGVAAWAAGELPALAATGATVVASLWGFSVADYRRAATLLAEALRTPGRAEAGAVVAVEVNISCPNVEDRQSMFAHSEQAAAEAVAAVVAGLGTVAPAVPGRPAQSGRSLPVWAKLSPNVTDLPAIAGAVIGAGAAGLTLVNTLMGLALDPATGRPRLGHGGGGLSGPALHPVAVRAVYECRAAWPGIPIVGVGGVGCGEDAAELLVAGADAVQVGTASFLDPQAPRKVLHQLESWCRRHGVRSVADLVGRSHR